MEGGGLQGVRGVDPGPALHQHAGHRQGGEEVAHLASVLKEVLSLQ